MTVAALDDDITISTEDAADVESADVEADPELADACRGVGPFFARRRRVDRTFLLALAVALFVHAAFVGAAMIWWLSAPPMLPMAGGSGAAEADGAMPGEGVDIAPIPQASLPQPADQVTIHDVGTNLAGESAADGSSATEGLRAIGVPALAVFSDEGGGRIGLSGESLDPPKSQHLPPPGQAGSTPAGVGGPAPAEGNRPPRYPREALRRHLEGIVMLRVKVSADGIVQDLHIDRSSGHDLLDDAALQAVRAWRFRPAMVRGAASACEVVVPIRFVLAA